MDSKKILIEPTELCSYGCGQIAKFKFKNGKLCCSEYWDQCLVNRAIKIKNPIPIKTTELCSYGCGQVAKYKLKNGKLCCKKYPAGCLAECKRLTESRINRAIYIPIPIETTELCSYGCGQIAKFKFKNGKLCCSNYYSKCPMNIKKSIGKQKSNPTLIKTTELCSYGCGQIAKFKFKNGKLCCNENVMRCSKNRKINSTSKKNKNPPILIETTKLCSYGCGNIAKYKFKTGQLCCSKYPTKCLEKRKINSESQKTVPIKTTELCSYGCGEIAQYKTINGKLCCSKSHNSCSTYKLTIEKIKEKYLTFYKAEEMRYNPEKLNEKEIQVRCNYNKCKNSKEQDGWFTPTRFQLFQRINCIETELGNDGGFFYCSNKCKEDCPSFNLHSDPFKEINSPHTQAEINTWRQEVLKRQKDEYGYNFCEMCNLQENLQVHHEKPQKTHPGMTLDPDNGIILCKDCHFKIGHKTRTECSTGNLANHNPCD